MLQSTIFPHKKQANQPKQKHKNTTQELNCFLKQEGVGGASQLWAFLPLCFLDSLFSLLGPLHRMGKLNISTGV